MRKTVFTLCLWLLVFCHIADAKADPVTGAAIIAAVSEITWTSVVAAIVKSLIASAILGGLSSMLSKKKKPENPDTSRTQMVREAITPRQYILGRTRISGAITFLNTYDSHKRAEMCVTFAGHPCDAIEQIYFDDNLLTLDSAGDVIAATDQSGNPDDTWVGSAQIKIGLGTPETDASWAAYAIGRTNGDWTADHKQSGCSKIWVSLSLNDRPGGGSIPNVSLIARGLICYDPRTELTAWSNNPAIALRQYLIEQGIVDSNGSNIDDDRVISAANICDERVESPGITYPVSQVWVSPTSVVSAITTAITGVDGGVVLGVTSPFANGDHVRLEAVPVSPGGPAVLGVGINNYTDYIVGQVSGMNLSIYPIGLENQFAYGLSFADMQGNLKITRTTSNQYYDAISLEAGALAVIKLGESFQITSTGTLPGGLVANTDYFVIPYNTANNVLRFATTASDAINGVVVDITSVGSGNIALVKTTESRYTCNGSVSSDTQPQDSIPDILTSMIGTLAYIGGKWTMLAGAYVTPSISFNEDDLDGSPTTQTKISLRDGFNRVKGTFYSPTAFYEKTSFPPVTNSLYLSQDGVESWNNIDLPFTDSSGMCQRIAKVLLEAIRQQITTSWPMKLTAMQCQVGNIVYLNRTRLGWVDKPFQVTNWQFTTRGTGEDARIGIDVTFREVAPAMFDWNSGEESLIDLSPNTTLPNAFIVNPPGPPVITERQILTNDSQSVKTVVDLTWAPSTSFPILQYQAEYKLVTDTIWTALPRIAGDFHTASIYSVAPGVYDFRVKAINNLGVYSIYSDTTTQEIYALLAPPSDIVGLTIQEVSSLAILRWTAVSDLAVRIGGTIHIRFTEEPIATASDANSIEVIPAIAGSSDHAVVPLKAGTYLVYAVNSAGTVCANAAKVSSIGATVLDFSTIGLVQEDTLFPGSNSGTVVDATSGILKLEAAGAFDDVGSVDGLPDWDDTGGVNLEGTYTFSAGLDLTTSQRVRLLTVLEVLTVNTGDSIDLRDTDIDEWPSFDGIIAGILSNAQIQARFTNDNPLGSPTWSDWNWLVNADYLARAFQFRIILTVSDPTYNIYVSKLRISVLQL